MLQIESKSNVDKSLQSWQVKFMNFQKKKKNFIHSTFLFERGASEAAAGCLASVAAKLVKTAIKNLFTISQTTRA